MESRSKNSEVSESVEEKEAKDHNDNRKSKPFFRGRGRGRGRGGDGSRSRSRKDPKMERSADSTKTQPDTPRTGEKPPKSDAVSPAPEGLSAETLKLNPFYFESAAEMVFGQISFAGYLRIVAETYKVLCDLTPRITLHMSSIEWTHMHMLLLAKRVQDVHVKVLGTKFPREVVAIVPERTEVFLLLWESLHSVGLVEDELISTRWMPVMQFPSKDYVPDILYSYDWKTSWDLVLKKRIMRLNARSTHLIPSKTGIADLTFRHPGREPVSESEKAEEDEEEVEEEEEEKKPEVRVPDSWDEAEDEALAFINRNALSYSLAKPDFLEADPDANLTTVSNYGSSLHWDPQLWKDYRSVINELPKTVKWSIDIPKTKDGNYGWILQVSPDINGYVAWAPHNKVPPIASFIAILHDFASFPAEQRERFCVKSSSIRDPLVLMLKWIHSFCPDRRTY
jgi:hypothetical protein